MSFEFAYKDEVFDLWPISMGQEAVFKLIDEDLTNALNILTLKTNKEQLNMSKDYQEGCEQGYKAGYNSAKSNLGGRTFSGAEIRKDYGAPKMDNVEFGFTGFKAAENSTRDSRMNARKIEDLSCNLCRGLLLRTELVHGVVYEHIEGIPCANTGKYIYRKHKLVYSE